MTSFEVLFLPNDPFESLSSSEFCFIPVSPNAGQNGPENTDSINMPTFKSATPDSSLEEIENHIFNLHKEIQAKKVTLKKNNAVMQEQTSAIISWHEKVAQASKEKQVNLEKAKEEIVHLKEENVRLQQEINELECCKTCSMVKACNQCNTLKVLTNNLQEGNNRLIKESNVLHGKMKIMKDYCKKLEKNILGLPTYLNDLQEDSKLFEAAKKISALKNALQCKPTSFDSDSDSSVYTSEEIVYEVANNKEEDFRKTVLELASARDKIAELEKQLKKQNAKEEDAKKTLLELTSARDRITELEKQLEEQITKEQDARKTNLELSSSRDKIIELKKRLEGRNDEIKSLKIHCEEQSNVIATLENKLQQIAQEVDLSPVVEHYEERCVSLLLNKSANEEKISKFSDFIGELQDEIKKLQNHLELDGLAVQDQRNKFVKAMKEVDELKAENKRLLHQHELQLKEMNEKLHTANTDKKRCFEEKDILAAQLCDSKLKIEELENDIAQLSLQMTVLLS